MSIKSADPSVEWRSIAGFRNVMVHDYLGIDLDIVWDVVENDLSVLKAHIAAVLAELGETP